MLYSQDRLHFRPILVRIKIIVFCIIGLSLTAHAAKSTAIKRIGYAIQMGAFNDVKNAERFTTKLQSKGIEAFYFRKDNGFYAVRFGDFPSKEKAVSIARRLVAEQLINSYYIAPPNEIVFTKPKEAGWQKAEPPHIKEPANTLQPVTPKEPEQTGSKATQDMGAIAARTAERFVGIPYRWGGNNVVDGMDCSGFVRAVYNLCGLSIPRTSREQFKTGDLVSKESLQDGDLVFFGSAKDKITHVGIYVGGGRFVHAPRRGEEIRITKVNESYFEKRFVGARRYF
ncbi:MAG: NlpC/P60 family protein [Desulfuromonadaceae bacterium]|nr:NlpC/P60 family protein [Desulfuromonadaceae bacterium]MDD2856409.1 NlpC/P60 family protein [Desulfuromonadaceae bacterium]